MKVLGRGLAHDPGHHEAPKLSKGKEKGEEPSKVDQREPSVVTRVNQCHVWGWNSDIAYPARCITARVEALNAVEGFRIIRLIIPRLFSRIKNYSNSSLIHSIPRTRSESLRNSFPESEFKIRIFLSTIIFLSFFLFLRKKRRKKEGGREIRATLHSDDGVLLEREVGNHPLCESFTWFNADTGSLGGVIPDRCSGISSAPAFERDFEVAVELYSPNYSQFRDGCPTFDHDETQRKWFFAIFTIPLLLCPFHFLLLFFSFLSLFFFSLKDHRFAARADIRFSAEHIVIYIAVYVSIVAMLFNIQCSCWFFKNWSMNLRRLSESEKRKGKKIRTTRAIEDKEDSFPTRIVFLPF